MNFDKNIPLEIEEELLKVGEYVLLHDNKRRKRKGGFLMEQWLGSYKISKMSKGGNHKLAKDGKEISGSHKRKFLKRYLTEQGISSKDETTEGMCLIKKDKL